MRVFFIHLTSGNCDLQTCYSQARHVKAKKFDAKFSIVELSLILVVILRFGVADVFCKNVDVSFVQTIEDAIVKVNVTLEITAQAAKQIAQEEYHQQLGNEKTNEKEMSLAGGHDKTSKSMQKGVKVLPTHIEHHNNGKSNPGVVSKGQKPNVMIATLSDSLKLTKNVRESVNSKEPCQPMPPAILRQTLGAAFNPRYMSIDKPDWAEDGDNKATNKENSRDKTVSRDQEWTGSKPQQKLESFQVHGSYTRILYEEPIETYLHSSINHVRSDEETKTFEVAEFESNKNNKQTSKGPINHHHYHKHYQHGHKGLHNGNNITLTDISESLNHTKSGTRYLKVPQNSADVDTELYFKDIIFDQVEPQNDGYQSDDGTTLRRNKKKATGADESIKSVPNRRIVVPPFMWICKSQIEWIDLGPNHFPRFLRSVTCTSSHRAQKSRCWFGSFECRPKEFTVKILRRKKDSCNPDIDDKMEGQPEKLIDLEAASLPPLQGVKVFDLNFRLPHELREEWVFEERAVAFCCECRKTND